MTTVYIVSKPCGCAQLRTFDRQDAVEYAKAHSLILDAIPTRTDESAQMTLNGPVDRECTCDQEASEV